MPTGCTVKFQCCPQVFLLKHDIALPQDSKGTFALALSLAVRALKGFDVFSQHRPRTRTESIHAHSSLPTPRETRAQNKQQQVSSAATNTHHRGESHVLSAARAMQTPIPRGKPDERVPPEPTRKLHATAQKKRQNDKGDGGDGDKKDGCTASMREGQDKKNFTVCSTKAQPRNVGSWGKQRARQIWTPSERYYGYRKGGRTSPT